MNFENAGTIESHLNNISCVSSQSALNKHHKKPHFDQNSKLFSNLTKKTTRSSGQAATSNPSNSKTGLQSTRNNGGTKTFMAQAAQAQKVKVDPRLKQQQPQAKRGNLMQNNSSFVGVNKYAGRHDNNYVREKEQGNIKNFKETKSGQNLNNNFATTKPKIAQT